MSEINENNAASKSFKIISTGTLKGGVGKSNVIFNLSGILAEELLRDAFKQKGLSEPVQDALLAAAAAGENTNISDLLKEIGGAHRLLLIDADPQFNLTNNVGIDVRVPGLETTQQIFESSKKAEELIYRSPIQGLPNIDIIPSSLFLTKTEMNLVSRTGREMLFFYFIKKNLDYLNEHYRYICIDTNPNLYMINQNVFLSSDDIIIVSDCSFNSISGAEFFMALWTDTKEHLRPSDNFRSIIVNKYDTRSNKRSADFLEYCQDPSNEAIANLLIKQYIPLNERLVDTEIVHQPINILNLKTSAERESRKKALSAYYSIMAELRERGILYAKK